MIECRNLRVAFEGKDVLAGIDFEVKPGDIKVIMGGSGSGKSTILRCILGLIEPDEGSVRIEGVEMTTLAERERIQVRKKIGMVFQAGALFDFLNVRENVGYQLYEEGALDDEEIERRVYEKLQFVDIPQAMEMMPAELSGGMQRRVAIARALISNPQVIFFDEPTTGLDPITANKITDHVRDLREKLNVGSVLVTHELRYAFRVGTEFLMLKNGKIVFKGSRHEMESSDDPYIQEFLA